MCGAHTSSRFNPETAQGVRGSACPSVATGAGGTRPLIRYRQLGGGGGGGQGGLARVQPRQAGAVDQVRSADLIPAEPSWNGTKPLYSHSLFEAIPNPRRPMGEPWTFPLVRQKPPFLAQLNYPRRRPKSRNSCKWTACYAFGETPPPPKYARPFWTVSWRRPRLSK